MGVGFLAGLRQTSFPTWLWEEAITKCNSFGIVRDRSGRIYKFTRFSHSWSVSPKLESCR